MTFRRAGGGGAGVGIHPDADQPVRHPLRWLRPRAMTLLLDVEQAGEVAPERQGHVDGAILGPVVAGW